MKPFDAAIIGGGVLGCFAARNLMRYSARAVLLEAADDVCSGITRANAAIVYAGYNPHPGTVKAKLTVRANASFDRLCAELDVPFARCGSLLVACGPKGREKLEKKLAQGRQSGVPGLAILSGGEARAMEPMLSPDVTAALYAPSTGTVNPWRLGIAAYENALHNGCEAHRNATVRAIRPERGMYRIETDAGTFTARAVLNCAGLAADRVHALAFDTDVRLRLDGADFLVFDRAVAHPGRVIYEESEDGKGVTLVPTAEGTLLAESPHRPYAADFATTREGLDAIRAHLRRLLPSLDQGGVIRSFGAVRPNPVTSGGDNIKDFCILSPAPTFHSLIGVKTPGLTAADALGALLAERVAMALCLTPNPDFDPIRKAIAPIKGSLIVCRCEGVTESEVREAIARGAVSWDGMKRRVGCGMGHCQGSRCAFRTAELLKEAGCDARI